MEKILTFDEENQVLRIWLNVPRDVHWNKWLDSINAKVVLVKLSSGDRHSSCEYQRIAFESEKHYLEFLLKHV
jgi:hypothetical protein